MLAPLTPIAARALLSPSARVLLTAALGEHSAASVAALPWGHVHWPTLVSLALHERAETHLTSLLQQAPPGVVPTDVLQAMAGIARVARFRSSELAAAAGVAVDALAAAGITALWLKGAALAMQRPEGFLVRGMGDLDLLIDELAQPAARAALRMAGWADSGSGERYEAHHHDAPMRWRGGLRLELHTGLFPPGHPFTPCSVNDWLTRAMAIRWEGRDVLVLQPAWHLTHASVHWAWSHEGEVGTWQYVHDTCVLSESVRASDAGWASVQRASAELGAGAPVGWALWFAQMMGSLDSAALFTDERSGTAGLLGGLLEREWIVRAWYSPSASPSVKWSRFWWRRSMNGLGSRQRAWPWRLGRIVVPALTSSDSKTGNIGQRPSVVMVRRWRRHLARVLGG